MSTEKSREEFLKGIKYLEEDGKIFAERDVPICDFCMGDPKERPIAWSYPAGDVVLGPHHPLSDIATGEWAACQGCYELIEQADFESLFERTFEQQLIRFAKLNPKEVDPTAKARMKIETLHIWIKFQLARTGPAIPESEPTS